MNHPPKIDDNTAQEDAAIQREIATNPDTWAAPETPRVRRRGRPGGSGKTRVTVHLDNDVIAQLKGDAAKGWQTRLNATLRTALGL